MSSLIDQATIKHRRDTASNWTSNDPVLNEGEFGFETDTLRIKIGDGVTAWTSLGYKSKDWVSQWTGSQASLVNTFGAGKYQITIFRTGGTNLTAIMDTGADFGNLIWGSSSAVANKVYASYIDSTSTFSAIATGAEAANLVKIEKWE